MGRGCHDALCCGIDTMLAEYLSKVLHGEQGHRIAAQNLKLVSWCLRSRLEPSTVHQVVC